MNDLKLALMCGTDIPFPECQQIIHQPTIKEIALIGEANFFMGVQSLSINKTMFITEDENLLNQLNNFQIFMAVMTDKETRDKRESVIQVLSLLFPGCKINCTPRSLLFKRDEETFIIDESNFDSFQNILKLIFCSKDSPMDQQSFNPANKKAKEIADKIMRGRQIVAEQKGGNNSSIFSQYISVLAVGLHSSPNEMANLTMFQLYDIIQRFSLYLSWDLDVRVRLAGGNPEEHPDNWMGNIH